MFKYLVLILKLGLFILFNYPKILRYSRKKDKYPLSVRYEYGRKLIKRIDKALKVDFHISGKENMIDEGNVVTLEWDVSDAVLVTLDSVEVEAQGSLELTPAETTTYVLEAVGTDGETVSESVTVTVIPKPEIISFTASSDTVEKGTLVTLSWETENVTYCEILTDDGLKLADRAPIGQVSITPNKTKTYTLIAYNVNEVTAEESITITVE